MDTQNTKGNSPLDATMSTVAYHNNAEPASSTISLYQEKIRLLQSQIVQKDQAIQELRDENAEAKTRNEEFQAKNVELERQKKEVEDQQTLYAKYKALLHVKEALEQRLASHDE